MKLLFDQNLSPLLVNSLAGLFPDSNHVFHLGIHTALSTIRGFPPKLIWLRVGNCTTAQTEELLRTHFEAILELDKNKEIGILSIL